MEKTAFIEGGVVPWSSLVLRLGKVPLTRLSVSRTSMERSKKKRFRISWTNIVSALF